ncbi:hypothetical protein C1645_834092 [Glomus cerebriforme]|uniref:Uncharacterized protein n=1 Tax=Glomus cerebriforme TaxID=658196 RepID=A0A397SEG8_9GLOM|nr:hypothetical protein C1645_834092 [Glomus cerebriforme]
MSLESVLKEIGKNKIEIQHSDLQNSKEISEEFGNSQSLQISLNSTQINLEDQITEQVQEELQFNIEQSPKGEKVAPYVFKLENTQSLQEYLKKERITYETYQVIPESEVEFAQEDKELTKAYQEISQDKERKKLTKSAQKASLKDLQKRL